MLITTDPAVQDGISQALSTVDRPVVAVANGKAAIAQAAHCLPVLILMDWNTVGMDSFTLCTELRGYPPLETIPILLITETQTNFDKDKGFQFGITDYLYKPFSFREVQVRVDTWLRLSKLEQQSYLQQQQLQRTEQSLRLLLHAVSHDLRNPVLGMQMVFQNLLQGNSITCTQNDEQIPVPRSFVERMVQGSDRHLSLIDALLDTHTEVTRPLSLHYEPVALGQFIPTILCEMKPWLHRNQATLNYVIPTDLPTIQLDPIQICRVLKNLVENALKHNPPGVEMQVEAQLVGDRIQCSVQDNGAGISAEQCEYLFKLFERGPNTRHTNGLGIGLHLCQQIIRAHGGDIHVANCPEGGARFWFTLPLNPARTWTEEASVQA
ncbi:ATP-binding protein [Leptolyngbya sp. NM2-A1]|uniref:hybrid sensor histidine kinase/response regulator n=1 Tax=unclassified Leptolyngbya TaxID=2650499 RepID=UPI00329947B5